MSGSKKLKEVTLTGKVTLKKMGEGSKSEHEAVYFVTEGASYVLRRKGENPFSDPFLHKLDGKKIEVTGIVNKYVFLASSVKDKKES
jgi:hypothetical protein